MTSLLLRWLNDDLKLKHKVAVLERDLSNGFVFAEILERAGVEKRLDKYKDASDPDAKIHNLELLSSSVQALGLTLPLKTRRAIMMEDRTAVMEFLLQVKDAVQMIKKYKGGSPKRAVEVKSRVHDPPRPPDLSNVPSKDVEERFVKETALEFHPPKVEFYKDINMAVHLRKFPQHQWKRENRVQELEEADRAENEANSMARTKAVRTHLHDKGVFMKEWDREHLKKWQHTQRLYMRAERDDLRLELTMEERKRRYQERREQAVHEDAMEGVIGFERNMSRLGLGGANTNGAAAQPLRAISRTDASAIDHLHSLEKRVAELDFRPSNNVKMMKELRERRQAQLAAEKERRMRRRKGNTDQFVSVPFESTEGLLDEFMADEEKDETARDRSATKAQITLLTSKEFHDQYLASKVDALEANYTRLREIGQRKRDEDVETLLSIRQEAHRVKATKVWEVCQDTVVAIVRLALAVASVGSPSPEQLEELKRTHYSSTPVMHSSIQTLCKEEQDELWLLMRHFLGVSDLWQDLSLSRPPVPTLCADDVVAFRKALRRVTPAQLTTSPWGSLASYKLIVVHSLEDRKAMVKDMARDHALHFFSLDELMEEAVKNSYDPVKQADHAATLQPFERELGSFGPRLAQLKQKNTPIPDQLAVEMVVAALTVTKTRQLEERQTPREGDVAPALPLAESALGCLLYNYPRSFEEAKLLEKALLVDVEDEELRLSKSTALEMLTSRGETVGISFAASVDGFVALVASDPPPTERSSLIESTANEGTHSASELKRMAQHKLEQEMEETRRRELVKLLEQFWGTSSRVVKIDTLFMHEKVVMETSLLAIDWVTHEAQESRTGVLECAHGTFPPEIRELRNARLDNMALEVRMTWMQLSEELTIQPNLFEHLSTYLDRLEREREAAILEQFALMRKVLNDATTVSLTTQKQLHAIVDDESAFQHILNSTVGVVLSSSNGTPMSPLAMTKSPDPKKSERNLERLLTQVEVSLGDVAEDMRTRANEFCGALDAAERPDMVAAVEALYRALPSMCQRLLTLIREKFEVLQVHLYEHVPFLRRQPNNSILIERAIAMDALAAIRTLGHGGAPQAATSREELQVLVDRVISEFDVQYTVDAEETEHARTFFEARMVAAEVSRWFQNVALLCRYADDVNARVRKCYRADIKRFRRFLWEDMKRKHAHIATLLDQLRADKALTTHLEWSAIHVFVQPLSKLGKSLPTEEQRHFLSLPQLRTFITECRDMEARVSDNGFCSFGEQEFVVLVLDIATRWHFPGGWRVADNVAALASRLATSHGLVSWRMLVLLMVSVQFVGFPTLEELEECREEIRGFGAGPDDWHHDEIPDTLTVTQFLKVPLWFERTIEDRSMVRDIKVLLSQLYALDSAPDSLFVAPMLLSWCMHPASSVDVRSDLEAFLPSFSRGTMRAFRLLSRWRAPPPADECLHLDLAMVLFAFADVKVNEEELLEHLDHRSTWHGREVLEFMAFCQTYTDVAARLLLENPFDTLVEA